MIIEIPKHEKEALEQLASLIDQYLEMGYYMCPIEKDNWFLMPLDEIEGAKYRI